MAQAGSTFVLNPRRSNSFCRRGASVEGNSDACALGATSRSPFTPRMAYLPGWFVIRMSTNDTGAGGGAFDFFPQRGTATDSTSKRKGLLGFLGGGALHPVECAATSNPRDQPPYRRPDGRVRCAPRVESQFSLARDGTR